MPEAFPHDHLLAVKHSKREKSNLRCYEDPISPMGVSSYGACRA